MAMFELWTFNDLHAEQILIGPLNKNINLLEMELSVKIDHINSKLLMEENDTNRKVEPLLKEIIAMLNELIEENIAWQERDLIYIIQCFKDSKDYEITHAGIKSFYLNKKIIISS